MRRLSVGANVSPIARDAVTSDDADQARLAVLTILALGRRTGVVIDPSPVSSNPNDALSGHG